VGITIRYLEPAAAGASFTYSVERREDEAFFDFKLGGFRLLGDIEARALTAPLIYHDGAATAEFNHDVDGEAYIVRIHRVGMGDRIVAEIPLTVQDGEGQCLDSKGGLDMEPSYRAGKKFLGGEVIEATYRLTFYGNDGFTIHTATLWDDGTTSCNCPRWTKKMQGMERGCPHSVRAQSLTANIDETGERPVAPPPTVPRETNPFRRRSRSVDT
jgi:hypothetical protein